VPDSDHYRYKLEWRSGITSPPAQPTRSSAAT
jgi:hypothetical protein